MEALWPQEFQLAIEMIFKILYVFICEWVLCLMYAVPHACRAHGGQKRALDILELKLQIVVSQHVRSKPSPLEGQQVL